LSEARSQERGTWYAPADPLVLKRYPSKPPEDPQMFSVYEQGQLRLYQLLFQSMPDGVIATDVNGMITEANHAALNIFGRRTDEVEGQSVFQFLEVEYGSPIQEIIGREIVRGRAIHSRHVFVRRLDGKRRSCTLHVFPLIEECGILRAVGIIRDRTELEELTQIDEKTKLLNHRTFSQRVQEQVLMARRKDKGLGLVYIDLRKFKELNDQFGHDEGDRVIKMVARRLDEGVFRTDFKARSNSAGDEFMLLLTDIDEEGVKKALVKIVRSTTFHAELIDSTDSLVSVPVSADIGVCWRRGEHVPDAKAFIGTADRAMFICKKRVKAGESLEYHIDKIS